MKRILLYGDSIFLAGLAARLHALFDLTVTQSTDPADLAGLAAIVVDLAHATDTLALLCIRPHLPVVGVDAASGTLTVLAGQTYPANSAEEVLKYLRPDGGSDNADGTSAIQNRQSEI